MILDTEKTLKLFTALSKVIDRGKHAAGIRSSIHARTNGEQTTLYATNGSICFRVSLARTLAPLVSGIPVDENLKDVELLAQLFRKPRTLGDNPLINLKQFKLVCSVMETVCSLLEVRKTSFYRARISTAGNEDAILFESRPCEDLIVEALIMPLNEKWYKDKGLDWPLDPEGKYA